jgi:TolB-like protein/tRNA A-37 threonylcarbamoyl transferase component Bud32
MELASRRCRFGYNQHSMKPGMQLGPYELLEFIGAGGMGEVWKARDPRLMRIVAIKTLTGQHGARFSQEARAIAALNHPYICQVYDIGPDYLVLEYIEGQPLPCPLAPNVVLQLALEIVNAIEAAHAKGILHRDLKPSNILMTRERSIKLLDFGLAKMMEDAPEATAMTVEGAVLGTAAYMSPEQAEGKTLDERSDVFSFGAVLYEMVSGKRAFGGGTTAQVLSAVLYQEPGPLLVEPALERIVRRCLAKRPAERFQSMSEVRRELEGVSGKCAEKQPSVAVLPFSIISADKEDEYFSDGLAEEIINALAHVPGLNVTARTSSFSFRGKDLDIRKVAEMLGVQTILEGSVRRSGSRIRVTVQLINAANGYHLWSERYDREMADVFAIQDEIAQAIASALKVKLSPEAATRRHTPGISAYEAFLKARHFQRKGTPESWGRARECLERSIALDPDFALAYAELAACLRDGAGWQVETAVEALPRARTFAQRALEIDPALPEAHAELAAVAVFLDYDWEMAGHHFRLAMAHNPIPAAVSHLYGFYYLMPLGRIREAIAELERSLTEDPLNTMCRTQLAVLHWEAGAHDEASAQFRQVLELDENFWVALMVQAIWQAELGNLKQGLAFAERAYAVEPKNPGSVGALAGLISRRGDPERAGLLLGELGDLSAYGVSIGLNIYHYIRKEFNKAADWAEKSIEEHHPHAIPGTCGPIRKHYVACGEWPRLARLLRLSGSDRGTLA